jgi:hypothetical protein
MLEGEAPTYAGAPSTLPPAVLYLRTARQSDGKTEVTEEGEDRKQNKRGEHIEPPVPERLDGWKHHHSRTPAISWGSPQVNA